MLDNADSPLSIVEQSAKRLLPESMAENERRLGMRLLNYWEAVRGDREFPTLEEIDPAAIADLWPHCFVLSLTDEAGEPVFSEIGENLVADCGDLPFPLPISYVPEQTVLAQAAWNYLKVLETRAPVLGSGRFEHQDGRQLWSRCVVLPLSGDGATIEAVLGAVMWRPAPGA